MKENIAQYTLMNSKEIKALNGIGKIYKHNKSGARVITVKNDDPNKTFSIAFKTPPSDHTGLPHILEHSVLCGSRKFPVKDPFVELAKGSLNTFLNAMTFSDKTMYPIASCNDKDFTNLMDVYLDAVLYPNIYNESKIFKQEGWHYSLKEKNDDLTYNGVVYNEMKGAFSSPERILMSKIQNTLFPDTAYGFESGGSPEHIPELSYEAFIAFHQKYYHPSNSYIYLYGDIDEEEKLQWLDEEYLSSFDAIAVDASIQMQQPFAEVKRLKESYPISSSETPEDKSFLSLNYVVSSVGDPYEHYGSEILEYVLFEAPGAPVKEALLKSGICQDVFSSLDNDIMQPTISIIAKGSNEKDLEKFTEIIQGELTKIVEEGIDKEKLKAALNYFEFRMREADFGRYPKGVMYAITTLTTWLHDEDPFMLFDYDDIFEFLNKGIENGYFVELIKKFVLDNKHGSILTLVPDGNLSEVRERAIKEQLEVKKNELSEENLDTLVKETKALLDYQNEPETKEAIESIPLLEKEDINTKNTALDYAEEMVEGIKVIQHEAFTNSIVYTKLLFDIKQLPNDLIPYAALLKNVLGKMNTKNYGYSKLSDQINIHTGGIHNGVSVYGVMNSNGDYRPYFEFVGKCFGDKSSKMYELIGEIIFNTDFSDGKRIKEIIQEAKSRQQMKLMNNGHVTALTRAERYQSQAGYFNDLLSGVGYFEFLDNICNDYDNCEKEVIANLKKVADLIFSKDNLLAAITTEKEQFDDAKKSLGALVKGLSSEGEASEDVSFDLINGKEGFMTSAEVQYVALIGDYSKDGYEYTGKLKVLKTILSLDYLWQNIRIKGGAYGAMIRLKKSGVFGFVSYRDPHLSNTVEVYRKAHEYIRELELDPREMLKYIIGTVSELDQPLTPSMENDKMLGMYIGKITNEDLQKERDEILSVDVDGLRDLADLVQKAIEQNYLCVVGNEGKVKSEGKLLGEVKYLVR